MTGSNSRRSGSIFPPPPPLQPRPSTQVDSLGTGLPLVPRPPSCHRRARRPPCPSRFFSTTHRSVRRLSSAGWRDRCRCYARAGSMTRGAPNPLAHPRPSGTLPFFVALGSPPLTGPLCPPAAATGATGNCLAIRLYSPPVPHCGGASRDSESAPRSSALATLTPRRGGPSTTVGPSCPVHPGQP